MNTGNAIPSKTSKTSSRGSKALRWLAGTLGVVVLLFAAYAGSMFWTMNHVPAGLDYATRRVTANGLYEVSYEPSRSPIPINQLHTWTLRVTTVDGRPVEHARISLDGDMPQHGHGLPTKPQVTRSLGDGRYLVEGVKFQMGGWWVMDFSITADGRTDTVRFNFILR